MKLLSVFFLSALSLSALAKESDHDPRDCPDLTGRYVYEDGVFDPMRVKLTSAKNKDGVPTLSILNEDDGAEDVILLDGRKIPSDDPKFKGGHRAACWAGSIYVYEYDNAALEDALFLNRMFLNADRDMVWDSHTRGEAEDSEVIFQRQ